MSRTPLSMTERFWMKVRKGDGCWEWTASKNQAGYGTFMERPGASPRRAHRFAYELTIGPIPAGLLLDHICHNRACVNPDHLRPVTVKQNAENRIGPGRRGSTGVLGVHRRKDRDAYIVRVKHNGQEVHGGQFRTLEEAAEAARQLRLSLFTHNDLDRRAA